MVKLEPFIYQKSLDNFYAELDSWSNLSESTDKNNVRCIIKRMTFLYIIKKRNQENNFFRGMFSDLLYAMHCIKTNQERYFYFNLRSAIENFLRCALYKGNTDNTGVRELFNEFSQKQKSIRDKLNSEYVKCCNYVHNNHIANLNYSNAFLECERQTFSSVSTAVNHLLNVINYFIKYFIFEESDCVDATFHRAKSQLKYLVGNAIYKQYLSQFSS
ncbi:TPA: hypothetical protein QB189_002279 [Pasteurella multocida]|uniref:hypothetical protein n=1 Tax=Pasteurella multocida TaxID=747 RepID=UPI00403DB179|nr:hypothetical protein [Pasteurella multocida]